MNNYDSRSASRYNSFVLFIFISLSTIHNWLLLSIEWNNCHIFVGFCVNVFISSVWEYECTQRNSKAIQALLYTDNQNVRFIIQIIEDETISRIRYSKIFRLFNTIPLSAWNQSTSTKYDAYWIYSLLFIDKNHLPNINKLLELLNNVYLDVSRADWTAADHALEHINQQYTSYNNYLFSISDIVLTFKSIVSESAAYE